MAKYTKEQIAKSVQETGTLPKDFNYLESGLTQADVVNLISSNQLSDRELLAKRMGLTGAEYESFINRTGDYASQTRTSTTSSTASEQQAARQSAYDTLYNEFKKYGLESLVEEIKGLITSNTSPSGFSIALQNTDAYKKRFAANQDRIKQGLRALTAAEYIGLEDQYQNIMRNYGLPESYWTKDAMGTQAGFNKFIANDVSAAELEAVSYTHLTLPTTSRV